MEAIHRKEYQLIRYRSLCKENTRLTVDFQTEFKVVKVRYSNYRNLSFWYFKIKNISIF